jgi:hypothetical protein
MENVLTPANGNALPPATAADAPISLRIAGADLLLSGRFEQWMPLVLAEGQEGKGSAQILFDVTSNSRRTPSRNKRSWDPDLFSFESTEVEALGKKNVRSYRIKGRMNVGSESGEAEATLQTPSAHTPFCVLLFDIDRTRFGELWSALEQRVDDRNADPEAQEVRPRAWLKAPALAAA